MDLAIWITFVVASCALLAIPRPTILLVVSFALGGAGFLAATMGQNKQTAYQE